MSDWRVGRKVGRTIYHQRGPWPSDDDPLIGVMDTRELAAQAVAALSALRLLVELKDGPRDAEYERRKEWAWANASAALVSAADSRQEDKA